LGSLLVMSNLAPHQKPSAAAMRMRLHRMRMRAGYRCLNVELRETEIDALVRRGLLHRQDANDNEAVCKALYAYFDINLSNPRFHVTGSD
jgi:hypothetical protein